MWNDLKRERKLPGFFDREVYEILDRGGGGEDEMEVVVRLSLELSAAAAPKVVFDSGCNAVADNGLFSDSEHPNRVDPDPNKEIPNPDPISLSEDQTFREEPSNKDYCLGPHLRQMLSYGYTRVEIRVQSTYEDVACDTNRGHTVAAVADCFCLAKDVGFKGSDRRRCSLATPPHLIRTLLLSVGRSAS